MIRIGVVSDSHGAIDLFEKAVDQMKETSAIVHLGDCASDALEITKRTGREIITINGNCDFFAREPLSRILKMEGMRIYLTHGHRECVKMGLMRLSYRAEEENAKLVLYGHTHIESAVKIGDAWFINPGAMKDGKWAIVTIKNGVIEPEFKRIAI